MCNFSALSREAAASAVPALSISGRDSSGTARAPNEFGFPTHNSAHTAIISASPLPHLKAVGIKPPETCQPAGCFPRRNRAGPGTQKPIFGHPLAAGLFPSRRISGAPRFTDGHGAASPAASPHSGELPPRFSPSSRRSSVLPQNLPFSPLSAIAPASGCPPCAPVLRNHLPAAAISQKVRCQKRAPPPNPCPLALPLYRADRRTRLFPFPTFKPKSWHCGINGRSVIKRKAKQRGGKKKKNPNQPKKKLTKRG